MTDLLFWLSRFNIDDLMSVNQYAVYMVLKLCYSQGTTCQKIIKLLDNARFPKENCTEQYAIDGKTLYKF